MNVQTLWGRAMLLNDLNHKCHCAAVRNNFLTTEFRDPPLQKQASGTQQQVASPAKHRDRTHHASEQRSALQPPTQSLHAISWKILFQASTTAESFCEDPLELCPCPSCSVEPHPICEVPSQIHHRTPPANLQLCMLSQIQKIRISTLGSPSMLNICIQKTFWARQTS